MKNSAVMVKLKDGRLGLVPTKQPKGIPEGKVVVELCDTAWFRTGEKILSSLKGAEQIGFVN
mgnify:CR=1 FL=1